jgi:hypothetical protein
MELSLSLFLRPLSKIRADLFHRDDDKSQQDGSMERNCGTHFDSLSPFLRLFLYSFLWLCTVRARRIFMFASSSSSSLSSDFGPLIGVTLTTDCINKKVLLLGRKKKKKKTHQVSPCRSKFNLSRSASSFLLASSSSYSIQSAVYSIDCALITLQMLFVPTVRLSVTAVNVTN